MAESKEMQLKDVAVELGELTWKEVKVMALHLNHMTWATLEEIENSSSLGKERVNRAIDSWMRSDVNASWAQLVSALRTVEQNTIAEKIRARYCSSVPSDTRPAPETYPAHIDETASLPSVAQPREELSVDALRFSPPQAHTLISFNAPTPDSVKRVSHSSLLPLSSGLKCSTELPQSFSIPSVTIQPRDSLQSIGTTVAISESRVRQVEEDISHLDDRYSDLRSDTHIYMVERERESPTFVDKFRITLLELPQCQQAQYPRLFENLFPIYSAPNVSKIFDIIRPYSNYMNYELLQRIVMKFGNPPLKQEMNGYVEELETFELKTTIVEFIAAASDSAEIPEGYRSVVVKINKDASVCTLREVRIFVKRTLAKKCHLLPHALMLQQLTTNTVVVTIAVPRDSLEHLALAFDTEFREMNFVVSVVIDGNRLEVYQLAGGCKTGDVSMVNGALHSGVDVNIKFPYEDGKTALHLASEVGHVLVVQALLDCGADVRARDRYGRTALHLASEKGHVLVVQALLDCGADVRAHDGLLQRTSLHGASEHGHLPVVQALLDAGADVRAQDMDQRTPLHRASVSGHLPVVQALLDAGADVRAQDTDQWTPLHLASLNGHLPVVQALLDAGADVRAQDMWGRTPLIAAAEWGKAYVVKELVRRGADMDAQDNKGLTALMYATLEPEDEDWDPTLEQCEDIVTVLVGEGADVNAQNEEGLTALIMAAKQGDTSLVRIIIGTDKVDVNIQENTVGWSAIFYAAKDGHLEITRLLLKAGANVLLKDRNNVTALDIARVHGRDSACQEMTTMVKKMTTPPQQQHPLQFLRQLVNKSGERAANVFKQLEKWLKQSQRKEQFYQKQRTMNQDELEQIQETITAPTN